MTDRELLEAAAKAAGYSVEVDMNWGTGGLPFFRLSSGKKWSPLTSDGDALRLATKLQIYVKHFPFLEDDDDKYPGFVEAWLTDDTDPLFVEYLTKESDRLAATRRAIVSAAAEIWKAQNDQ